MTKMDGNGTSGGAVAAPDHTLLLLQPSQNADSRTYCDYETLQECLEGICKIFEAQLKRQYPNQREITYDISQLFHFIDDLFDMCVMVLDDSSGVYVPYNKSWTKEKIYNLLTKQAIN